MPELSRSQFVVYGAIGVVLLLLGARWIRSSEEVAASSPAGAGVTVAAGTNATRGGGGDLVVHVAGEVRKPGVYELVAGSRVADAVEEAGGATGEAILDGINLAAALADGQQVVVPGSAPRGGAPVAGGTEGSISLGTATVQDLETIDGIGPVTAGKIVEFRDQSGGLASVEELEAIHGIGPATVERLREHLQP